MATTTKPTMQSTLITRGAKLDPAIAKRIERLGKLNDSFKRALGARNRRALRRLANQYQAIGCPQLAGDVRRQARSC